MYIVVTRKIIEKDRFESIWFLGDRLLYKS
jgi:hypothetical protein